MATYQPPKRGVEYITYVSLVSQADAKLLKANPTLAAGDVQISKDGGAFANLATLPTVTPAAGKGVKVTLSATEMTADNVLVIFSDAAGAEWCDLSVNLQTSALQIDDLATPTNITAGTITTATNLTNLPSIPANWLTAAGINAAALNGKGDWNIGKTGYALSAAGVQAVWDALTSALTAAGSVGKLIVDNLNATITSRMASYTQPTGFLAATFPTGTVANTTNVTAATGIVLSGVTHTGAVIPTVTAVTNDVGITQAGADKTWLTATRALTDKAGFALSSAGVQAIWDALTSALTTVGSIGKLIVDNLNATISSRASQTSLDTLDDYVDTEVAAIKAKTDALPAAPAATGDAMALTGGERTTLAGVIGTTAQTEAYRANGATGSIAQILYEILAHLTEASISGTTKTVKKIDHTATATTSTLDSATAPTSITRAT